MGNKEELIKSLETASANEKVCLRGRLISLMKSEIKKEKDPQKIAKLRLELLEELNKHKTHLKSVSQNKIQGKITLKEKMGLKIQQLSTTMKIFMEKHDVIERAKNFVKNTASGAMFAGAITTVFTLASGGAITLPVLASLIPTTCYIGISNLVSMPFQNTSWTSFLKKYSNKEKDAKEVMNFLQNNLANNSALIDLTSKRTKTNDNQELAEINEKIIIEQDKLIAKAQNSELKEILTFEKINTLNDLKKQYQKIKKDHIKNRKQLSASEVLNLNKKMLSVDANLFKEDNFLKEVGKKSLKNLSISAATMYASRALMSVISPQYALTGLKDAITPLLFTVASNVSNMGNIKRMFRAKQKQYNNQKIILSDPEKFDELSHNKAQLQMA